MQCCYDEFIFYMCIGKAIRNITRKNPEDKKSDITFEEFIQFALYKSGKNVEIMIMYD